MCVGVCRSSPWGRAVFFLAWYFLQSVDVNPCCVRTYEKTGGQLSCQLMNVNYLCVVSTYYIRVYVKYVLVYVDSIWYNVY